MAANKTRPKGKKTAKKKAVKKKAVKKAKALKSPEKAKDKKAEKRVRRRKCCPHCPDHEYCEDRGFCCDYCDFYLNGKCTYGKKKGIPSLDNEIELPDYRGDDYGIDDYEAYESAYD